MSAKESLHWLSPNTIFNEAELRWGDDELVRSYRSAAAEKMARASLYFLGAIALHATQQIVNTETLIVDTGIALSAIGAQTMGVMHWIAASSDARIAHTHEDPGACQNVARLNIDSVPQQPGPPDLPPPELV